MGIRMPAFDHQSAVDRLVAFQAEVRDVIIASRRSAGLHEVSHATSADTIYRIDTAVEPILDAFCEEWAETTPLVLIAEGVENKHGEEGVAVYPRGTREEDAQIRLIVDPIDGTRGIMYDKRAAWALAGVAPNKGPNTRLRDIEVAVMTELPTSKMGFADVLTAIKGRGATGMRVDLANGATQPLPISPSTAAGIDHGFASVANFFPGTKRLASELMEHLVANLIGPADVTKATVFDDQYISTGGQSYELIVGHDRFNADLRPVFYRMQGQPEGLCCHPYDCASMLIAEEAGVVLTDEKGEPLDGPLDVTSGISWVGYANAALRERMEPVLRQFLTQPRM
jgi:fructose-1,6-bisphosphatase/inositol monophosphatase family enzyme